MFAELWSAPWTSDAFRSVSDKVDQHPPLTTSASVQVVCSSVQDGVRECLHSYGTSLVVDVSQCVKAAQSPQNTQGSLLGSCLMFNVYIGSLLASTSWSVKKQEVRESSPGGWMQQM